MNWMSYWRDPDRRLHACRRTTRCTGSTFALLAPTGERERSADNTIIDRSPRWSGGIVDEDLDAMTREQLIAEARLLRAGIRMHRDSTGHALCWHHPALWGILPEKIDPCRQSLRGRSFSGAAYGTGSLSTSSCLMRPAPTRRISRDDGAACR